MKKELNLLIPCQILSLKELTPSDKLIYGFHYKLKEKKGYSEYTNTDIGKKLNIHHNKVGSTHKKLVEKGFLIREKRKYTVTDKYKEIKTPLDDKRDIVILFEVYSSTKIVSGCKLLWGEYNSISEGRKEYFMKRIKTSLRLGVSKQSLTNWTKILYKHGFLKMYENRYGYNCTQCRVITKKFVRTKEINKLNKK